MQILVRHQGRQLPRPVHLTNFKVDTLIAYQDGHYSHAATSIPYTDVNGNTQFADTTAAAAAPAEAALVLTPSYNSSRLGNILPYVTYTHVGQRYEDRPVWHRRGLRDVGLSASSPTTARTGSSVCRVPILQRDWPDRRQCVGGVPIDRAASWHVRSKAARSISDQVQLLNCSSFVSRRAVRVVSNGDPTLFQPLRQQPSVPSSARQTIRRHRRCLLSPAVPVRARWRHCRP